MVRAFVVMTAHSGLVNELGARDDKCLSARELLIASGNNLGNFAFKFGTIGLSDAQYVFGTYSTEPEFVRKSADVIVLPEANITNKDIDYSHSAKFIEFFDMPVLQM